MTCSMYVHCLIDVMYQEATAGAYAIDESHVSRGQRRSLHQAKCISMASIETCHPNVIIPACVPGDELVSIDYTSTYKFPYS